MALITCPDCGTEVSSVAASCPKCGRPINVAPPRVSGKTEGLFMQSLNLGCVVMIVLAGLFLLLVIFSKGCSAHADATASMSRASISRRS